MPPPAPLPSLASLAGGASNNVEDEHGRRDAQHDVHALTFSELWRLHLLERRRGRGAGTRAARGTGRAPVSGCQRRLRASAPPCPLPPPARRWERVHAVGCVPGPLTEAGVAFDAKTGAAYICGARPASGLAGKAPRPWDAAERCRVSDGLSAPPARRPPSRAGGYSTSGFMTVARNAVLRSTYSAEGWQFSCAGHWWRRVARDGGQPALGGAGAGACAAVLDGKVGCGVLLRAAEGGRLAAQRRLHLLGACRGVVRRLLTSRRAVSVTHSMH